VDSGVSATSSVTDDDTHLSTHVSILAAPYRAAVAAHCTASHPSTPYRHHYRLSHIRSLPCFFPSNRLFSVPHLFSLVPPCTLFFVCSSYFYWHLDVRTHRSSDISLYYDYCIFNRVSAYHIYGQRDTDAANSSTGLSIAHWYCVKRLNGSSRFCGFGTDIHVSRLYLLI